MINLSIRKIILYSTSRNLVRRFHKSSPKFSELSGWGYRSEGVKPPAKVERSADIWSAFMWYWILYHCFTQYDHLIGEFDYPDVSKWTDKELGIPESDE